MVPGKISALPQSPPTVPEPPIAPSNPASAMARHNPPQSLSDVRQLPPQRRLTDDAELTWPNLLFFVQPDGAIAFYRVRHLCSMPRCVG